MRRFGYFLLEVTFVLVGLIFALNVYFEHPFFDALLFSLAIAIGLTPQLLPAIISVNLAHGARKMAASQVIVRKLSSIENFGSMDILCSDKTGTLTHGQVKLHACFDAEGRESPKALLYAFLNASFQQGYENPIDRALVAACTSDLSNWKKCGEIPYNFLRKRITIVASSEHDTAMITKGAVFQILEICATLETAEGQLPFTDQIRDSLIKQFKTQSSKGYRVIAIAYKRVTPSKETIKENEMTFLGMLVFSDPLKKDVAKTIQDMAAYGVHLKIITGDNRYAAAAIGEQVLSEGVRMITGEELSKLSEEALMFRAERANVFAEIEPNQKEQIVRALRNRDHVVGYLGDGINDVSAMHAADVSISVDKGHDCAKEIADIVLLKNELSVLKEGIKMGRITFANTLKYVSMATSANFGNMFSMAGASLLLPFLPLLPKQVLLINLLTDLPEMAIAFDRVDEELIEAPRRWDIRFIRRFMLVFGLISSFFDYLTFGVLLYGLGAGVDLFRTGWFVESVVSATLIILIIRTRHPFYSSPPAKALLLSILSVIGFVLCMPFTPLLSFFGLAPLPPVFLLALFLILAGYMTTAEIAKHFFNQKAALPERARAKVPPST